MKKLNLIKKTGCCSSTIDIKEDDIDMDFFEHIDETDLQRAAGHNMGIRADHEFEWKALWLDNSCDYIIGKDSEGVTLLVPLKKK